MRALKTTMGIAAVACALVASMVVPAMAVAAPSPKAARSVATTPTPSKRTIHKYNVLSRARYNRFKISARVITRKLDRLSAIASRVESAGADVTEVRGHIADSRAHVESATVFATAAAAKLKAVPYAKNRARALAEANRGFRAAHRQLEHARVDRRKAAKDLWAIIKKLKMTKTVSAATYKAAFK